MTDHGKWSEPDVPHKGWHCEDVEDLGEPAAICEMCEFMTIRYVHHMRHPDYPEALGVGCVCAENMAEDYVGPRLREKLLRALALRRKTWQRRRWYRHFDGYDLSGQWYLNTEGFHLRVFPVGGAWAINITNRSTRRSQGGKQHYPSVDAAKAAALTALLWAKEYLI